LDFNQPAVILERQVRAYDPWPGTWFDWNEVTLKVLRARVSEQKSPGVGKKLIVDGLPAVGTADGLLILDEIQPAGKKPMPGKAFAAGARSWSITNNDE
jgi:methionyl-tRNA formyltransferase